MSLEALFNPESVAVVGASRSEGKAGHTIVANLIAGGCSATIVPINPATDQLLGLSCYPSLADYGKEVDLVVVALPGDQVKAVIEECRKVKVVIVIATGFKESSEEGARLEQDILELCHRRGIRLLGPNSLGMINTEQRLNVSLAGAMPEEGGLSIFSQSASLYSAMLDLAADQHLGLAKMVSIGNKADISGVDILANLAHDEQTKVVVGYIEDIVTGKTFVKAAEEAASQKPVIVMKSGTTPAGRKAAASHTGMLASGDSGYAAAFKRSGVIRADSFGALFDYAAAFSSQPLPNGNRILVITNAGGPAILGADGVEQGGMRLVGLQGPDEGSREALLPEERDGRGFIEILGDVDPKRYGTVIKEAQGDPDVDGVLLVFAPQSMRQPAEAVRSIVTNLDGSKPVVATFIGGRNLHELRHELAALGLPIYETVERAVASLKVMEEYATWKKRPPRTVTRFRVNRRRVERILTRRRRTGRLQLGEVKAKAVLGAYGFRIPEGALASSAEEAQEIAERLGFPVAMKIVSPDIIHKSDLGGVFLNVASGEAAEDTYDLMTLKIRKKVPDARIEGVYVEKMVDKGLEVIIGMSRDPQFGPMLMFGLGGIFVEVMKDVTFHLAPITEQEAIQMLKSTRSYAMLQGRRGEEGVDLAAIASGLQRISQLTTDFPQILELDINPFIVGSFGSEPVVADARITLAPLPKE